MASQDFPHMPRSEGEVEPGEQVCVEQEVVAVKKSFLFSFPLHYCYIFYYLENSLSLSARSLPNMSARRSGAVLAKSLVQFCNFEGHLARRGGRRQVAQARSQQH